MATDENPPQVAIEKPLTRIVRAGTEMPPGILSMKPLATVPVTARAMNSPTIGGPGPAFQGQPGSQPTPLAVGISPNVEAALPNDEKGQRVRDVVSRKT